jgi:hypothetical protein
VQHRLYPRLERSVVGPGFADEVAQGLLADDRVDRRAHRVLRPADGGIGDREQESLLAADPAQVVQQLCLDAAFGARVDLVHDAYEQLDQRVGDLTDARPAQACQQRQTHFARVSAKPRGVLQSGASAPPGETGVRGVGEQVGG